VILTPRSQTVTLKRERYAQEIRDPESVEEVSSSGFLLSVVLSKVDEVEDISVPGFQVDATRPTMALVSCCFFL
jgi:hypothetical protein